MMAESRSEPTTPGPGRRAGTVLLLGAGGQLGWELARALATLGPVVAPDRPELDLRDADAIRRVMRETTPALVVNAAAYTAVDEAEAEADTAMLVNATAPGILAEEARALRAGVVHYSTDYVFDGTSTAPYREDDAPRPCNVYGRSKLAGEGAVLATGAPALVLRTSWVYGRRGRNFFSTVLRRAEQADPLRVVDDQVGAPTWCRLLAEATAQVLSQARGAFAEMLDERGGLYHLTCAGETSWFGFAEHILAGLPEGWTRPPLAPITSGELGARAARPAYSVLDNTRVRETFGIRLPDWRTGLALVLAECGASQTAARLVSGSPGSPRSG